MTTDEKREALQEIGAGAYASIAEMVAALDVDWDRLQDLRDERDDAADPEELAELEAAAGDCEDADDARQRIEEDPLSVEVGGWWMPGGDPDPTEYRILLGTGGPATRIVGDIGLGGEPSSARLQAQDWFTPWVEYLDGDSDILLRYAQCFYFDEPK